MNNLLIALRRVEILAKTQVGYILLFELQQALIVTWLIPKRYSDFI